MEETWRKLLNVSLIGKTYLKLNTTQYTRENVLQFIDILMMDNPSSIVTCLNACKGERKNHTWKNTLGSLGDTKSNVA
jgi:uncharacterized alpha-E superfamily protein